MTGGRRPTRSRHRPPVGPMLAALMALLCLTTAPAPLDGQDSLRAGPLVLHYWPEQAALARQVLERLEQQPPLPALPDSVLDRGPVNIYLAPDAGRWDSLTGGAAPEWGAGIANPQTGLIVLPTFDWQRTPPHTIYRTLRHELAHVALQRHVGAARVPRWFSEGYAQWAAGEWRWESAWQLRMAFVRSDSPPLDSLTLHWPVAESEARLAYLLSASAIAYLVERSGERGLRIFMERWREQVDFDAAFRDVYGLTLGQFEEDWRAYVKQKFGWTVILGHSLIFWFIAALLLIVLVVIRRRRDRARLEKLKANELPEDPAFWAIDFSDLPGPADPGSAAGSANRTGSPDPTDPPDR